MLYVIIFGIIDQIKEWINLVMNLKNLVISGFARLTKFYAYFSSLRIRGSHIIVCTIIQISVFETFYLRQVRVFSFLLVFALIEGVAVRA